MIDIFTPFSDAVLQLSAIVGLSVIVASLVYGAFSLFKAIANRNKSTA